MMKRSVAVGLLIGAVAGCIVGALVRSRRGASDGPVVAATAVGRNARLARLGARAGARHTVAGAQRVFASAARREEIDRRVELRHAEDVARELGAMKGALMKLGQMISYLDEGLPEHVRTALAQLQQDAPPMSVELAAQMIEEQLGAPPDQVFATFDPDPIAAASIGQVHRAITHDGRAVAVKVQYPGIAEAVESDLGNVGLLFGSIGRAYPGFETGPLVDELRERLREELDYRLEARRQQTFADYYADHPFVHVPAVIPALSAARVLTTELAEGVRFAEAETWSADQRDLAGEAIFRFVFRSFYRLHLFNGDPHPGNYLFRPDGHVTFLDFGLVKRFTSAEVDLIGSMLEAMVVHRDIKAYRRLVEEIGMLAPGNTFTDDEIQDYFGHFYDFVQRDEVSTLTPEYASETVRRFFDASGPHGPIMKAANVPPTFVIIQRINLGLYAIFGQLRATANWRRISEEIWPFVEGPPSTELGRQAAAWAAERGHR